MCEVAKVFISDLGMEHMQLINLFFDNQAAMHIVANLVFRKHTKYINLDCHVVHEKIRPPKNMLYQKQKSTSRSI